MGGSGGSGRPRRQSTRRPPRSQASPLCDPFRGSPPVGRTGDCSFPSDHVAVAASVAAALCRVVRRRGLPAAILAGFMALARVYVGAHYPGDVAGGIVIGVLVALAGWPPAVRVLEPLAARLARSPLRPLVFARDTQ